MTYIREALLLVLHIGLPFLGPALKSALVKPSSTKLWRWELEKECLPARVHGIWPPHITLTGPWIAVHACMGLAADLVFRKGSGSGGAALLFLYAAALGAAWLSWPPALIRGNRLQAAGEAVVFLGAFMGLAVRFHSIEPLSGFLLLPFVGYSVFAAALLNLSMHSSNAEVADAAQKCIGVKCFRKEHYPLPDQAAAAFSAASEQGFSSDEELHKAQRDLVDATEAATCSGPSTSVSAFASPGIQKGDESDVSQAKDLLGKAGHYMERAKRGDGGPPGSPELLQSTLQQAQRLLTRVWEWLCSLFGYRWQSPQEYQVSSRLSAGPQAVRASADMRGSGGLRLSISGALQRVSGIRSPSGATESGNLPRAGTGEPLLEAEEDQGTGLRSDSIPLSMFSCPGAAGFKVRGPNYLQDKKKVIPEAPVCTLVSLNLLQVEKPMYHIAPYLPSVKASTAPLLFIWHVLVPGKQNYSLAITWALDYDPVQTVHNTLNGGRDEEPEEASGIESGSHGGEALPAELGAALLARRSLKMRKSQSLQDAEYLLHRKDRLMHPVPSKPSFLQVAEELRIERDSAGSGASFATDAGGLEAGQKIERSSKSLSALKPESVPVIRRHKRAATMLDGSQPPEVPKDQQPVTQPNTPVKRSLWGSRAAPPPEPAGPSPYAECDPFDVTMMRFLDESKDEKEVQALRSGAFKIIPRIAEGSWVIKQSVGQNTPVLLGRKLTTQYYRGENYIEVDVDVGSSRTAANVVGTVQGSLKSLVIDLAVLLEGHSPDELPERLLGTCRLEHLDLSMAAHLDTETGVITRKALG